jgi:class 3 adenylate cyclase
MQGQMAVIDGGDRILVFERIVPIIHVHGGHIDKYVGDGLLAVFGAPRCQ